MNQTEKVAKWCNEYYGTIKWDDMTDSQRETWLREAKEILDLIDQQAEPVAFIDRDDLESLILSHTQTKGVVGYKYKDAVPLYLNPPTREREGDDNGTD